MVVVTKRALRYRLCIRLHCIPKCQKAEVDIPVRVEYDFTHSTTVIHTNASKGIQHGEVAHTPSGDKKYLKPI